MLTVIRNYHGKLILACEWVPVDINGLPEALADAEFVWVNQLETNSGIHPSVIRQLCSAIADAAPQAKGAYWERRDKTGHQLHAFRRDQLVKEVKVNGRV